jgi:NDP-sugar pyrophosphorylase family protein
MLELGGRTLLSRLIDSLAHRMDSIRVVVGYREELVINHCAKLHRNIVIVRNPNFRTTNTVQSMAMGAYGLTGKTLFLDGDLVIDPTSLNDFIDEAGNQPVLAAIAPSRSENPVNVELADGSRPGNEMLIAAFTRRQGLAYEWANVVAGPPRMLDNATGYVFERLEGLMPLKAFAINLREVDTASDLDLARDFVKVIDGEAA